MAPSSPAADVWTGRLVGGRWRILSLLDDSGGMARVYLADDERLPRKAVVKILKAAHLHAEFADQIAREARWRALVSDLNVVLLIDHGEEGGTPFLVLPYRPGGNLEAWCRRNPSILADPRLHYDSWLLPIAQALDAVAARGLPHRDVKPSNILFDSTGQASLADGSIPKGPIESQPHGTGMFLGTLQFMSPELCQSETVVPDGRSDQYGLAVTLYQVLTGWKYPVEDDTAKIFAAKFGFAPLTEPREHDPRIPQAVNDAVMRALSTDRDKRFASSVEFAKAVLAGFVDLGPPAGGVSPGKPFRRRLPALLLGGAGLLATVIAGLTLSRVGGRPQLPAVSADRIARPPEPAASFPPAPARRESPRLVGQDQADFAIFDETRTWVSAQGRTVAVERSPGSLLDPRIETAWLASAGPADRFADAHRLFPEGFPLCLAAFPASFGLADRLDAIAATRLTADTLRLCTCSEIAALGYEARRRRAAGPSAAKDAVVLVVVVSADAISGTRAELGDGLVHVTASAGIGGRTISADPLARDLARVAAMVAGGDRQAAIGEVVVTCPQALEPTVAEAVAVAALPARASVLPDLVSDGLAAQGAVLTGTTSDALLLLMQAPPTHLGVLIAGSGGDEFVSLVTPGTTIPTDRRIAVRLPATTAQIVVAEKQGDVVRPLHTLQLAAGDRRGQGRVLEVVFDIDADMGLRVEAAEPGGAPATWSAPNRRRP